MDYCLILTLRLKQKRRKTYYTKNVILTVNKKSLKMQNYISYNKNRKIWKKIQIIRRMKNDQIQN